MNKAGIHAVAQAAGVSISTVSRAFTRPELVSEHTRQRVLATADKLDFNISRSAGSLKTGQTYRVALLINEEITSWFNAGVFSGINAVLHPLGYDISLFEHIDTATLRHDFFTNLPIRSNVDAIFVASFAIQAQEVNRLKRTHVPLIGINTPTTANFDASISIDDESGMYVATQHLINLGHQHIVYVGSEPTQSIHSSIDARERGFQRACRDAGILEAQTLRVPRGKDFAEAALAAVLSLPHFPDAICCQMDMMAIPLTLKLQHYGYTAPQNYSIIGFDDSHYADTINLTTMRQDPQAMGRIAAKKALQLIDRIGDGVMPAASAAATDSAASASDAVASSLSSASTSPSAKLRENTPVSPDLPASDDAWHEIIQPELILRGTDGIFHA